MEDRGEVIDEGLARLRPAFRDAVPADPGRMVEQALAAARRADDREDDLAMLAVVLDG